MTSVKAAARILQPEKYKRRIAEMWEVRGESYDSSDTFHQALALKLVQLANIEPGQTVLDVATGTGMVALPAAEIVGETGHVTGIDISESMLAEVKGSSAYYKM